MIKSTRTKLFIPLLSSIIALILILSAGAAAYAILPPPDQEQMGFVSDHYITAYGRQVVLDGQVMPINDKPSARRALYAYTMFDFDVATLVEPPLATANGYDFNYVNDKAAEIFSGGSAYEGELTTANYPSKVITVGNKTFYVTDDTYIYDMVQTEELILRDLSRHAIGLPVLIVANGYDEVQYVLVYEDNTQLDQNDITSAFTDPNFLAAVREVTGKPSGPIYASDVASITYLDVNDKNIFSLAGIEYFTALQVLYCFNNNLTSLDVSSLKELQELRCMENQLASLNIGNLTKLQGLFCGYNQISLLNVSNLTGLKELSCPANRLSSLDVSGLTRMEHLYCEDNQLASLNVSRLTNLKELVAARNQLATLDVSRLTNLQLLACDTNQLTALDVSNLKKLEYLNLSSNQLSSVDLSSLNELTNFTGDNQTVPLALKSTGNSYYCYITLNNPTFGSSALSYSNSGTLKSLDTTVTSTDFTVQTGKRGFELSGTLELSYSGASAVPPPIIPPNTPAPHLYSIPNATLSANIDNIALPANRPWEKPLPSFDFNSSSKLTMSTDKGNIFEIAIWKLGDNVVADISYDAMIYWTSSQNVYHWVNTLERNYNTVEINISDLKLPNGTYSVDCWDNLNSEGALGGSGFIFIVNNNLATFPTIFSDVPPTHWAYDSIMLLVEKGIIQGYGNGKFGPNDMVTRNEFAKMMTLALELPLLTNPTQTFEDVDPGFWSFKYVETAKKYLTGYQQGDKYYFKGNVAAVREDMAVALVKALGLEDQYVDVNELKTIFTDYNTISPALQKYVLIAYKNGLISGYPDGTFGPQKSITRAETASLLVKVLKSEAMQKITFD